MSTSERMRAAIAAGMLGLVALASCTLAPDHCLRMSDCGDGTTCVQGLCETSDTGSSLATEGGATASPEASTTTGASPGIDGSTTTTTTASSDASADASADAASDGAMTDAATD